MSWKTIAKNLRELRVHVCPTSTQSQGLREFLFEKYVEIKKMNPGFSFLIREGNNCRPQITARYDYGEEKTVNVSNQNPDQIAQALQDLIKQSNL